MQTNSSPHRAPLSKSTTKIPAVPLTQEGAYALHQFYRFDWKAWRSCAPGERKEIAEEYATLMMRLEKRPEDSAAQTAIFAQIGHKGDLALLHLRRTPEEIQQVELDLAQSRLHDILDLRESFFSVVEQGLYESSRKTYEAASAQGFEPHSPEWNQSIADSLARGAAAMAPRLFPAIPDLKSFCFYPMNRRRGEAANWYTQPLDARQRMMHEHGTVGRRYAGEVKQIITGAMGLDDWEWGVTLFADSPISFKKIVYEMRFDEVSAVYGEFGRFYVALRLPTDQIEDWLSGQMVR